MTLPTPSSAYAKALIDLLSKEEFDEEPTPDCGTQSRLAKKDDDQPQKLRVVPNPTSSSITFLNSENTLAELTQVRIFNAQGQLTYQVLDPEVEIDISHLPDGLYLVIAENTQGTIIRLNFIKS